MAKLRKWVAYRKIERPYTRYSKYKKKGFVKSRPGKTIVKFNMGNIKEGENFDYKFSLLAKEALQVRTNSIEAARTSILRKIEKLFSKEDFLLKIKVYPHQVIRENKLAAGAGADRLSTGMKHSFGKVIGTAVQVKPNTVLLELYLKKNEENTVRSFFKLATSKLPVKTSVKVN